MDEYSAETFLFFLSFASIFSPLMLQPWKKVYHLLGNDLIQLQNIEKIITLKVLVIHVAFFYLKFQVMPLEGDL